MRLGHQISTWLIWLLAAAVLLIYCLIRSDTLFTLVQVINITAIIATIFLARRGNQICPYHFNAALPHRVVGSDDMLGENYVALTND